MSVINLNIYTYNIDVVITIFDQLQVWRSDSGELGPYSEITAATATKALLDGTVQGPWNLNGQSMTLTVDGTPTNFTFLAADPQNIATVLAQFNSVAPGVASEVPTDTDRIRLESLNTGAGASIQATGNAATLLGFSDQKANGKSTRVPLQAGVTNYLFVDADGSTDAWYKIRYYASGSGAVSEFSEPRKGSAESVAIPILYLSKAMINLAKGDGTPISNRRVSFVPMSPYEIPTTDYWSLPGVDRLFTTTNEMGYAEIYLVRGMRFRVFFGGTYYHREFVVPDVDEFDVLDHIQTEQDPFDIVQVPPRPIKVTI